MKRLGTLILLVVLQQSVTGQTFRELADLPSACHESSGIECIHNNLFVTHNDGGDGPILYFIDSSGIIQREVFVQNATNTDWEDISIAPDGRVFIGNFGNNNHSRKDLEILILPDYTTWQTDTVTAKRIEFRYGDQNNFPPPSNNHVFDCEALAYFNDSLYLFSKNWSDPFNGQVKMYVMPAQEGNYVLMPRDSANLGAIKEIAWVTGADISDSSLYLVGSAFVWKFDFQTNPNLHEPAQLALNHFSQKEAISVFNEVLYITDESTGGFGNLYSYTPARLSVEKTLTEAQSIEVRQSKKGVDILNPYDLELNIDLYSLGGKHMTNTIHSRGQVLNLRNIVPNDILLPGIYVLHISTPNTMSNWFKVQVSE